MPHADVAAISSIKDYLSKAKAPLLINSCSDDEYFPATAQEQADKILGGGKFTPGYVRKHWEGCSHGFTIRGDIVRVLTMFSSKLRGDL